MRRKIVDFMQTHALSYGVAFSSAKEIDDQNILCATISTMHKALDELHIIPSHILVDGTQFKKYKNINHDVIKGDKKYMNIAAASILAKVTRDDYIVDLCYKNPRLDDVYF